MSSGWWVAGTGTRVRSVLASVLRAGGAAGRSAGTGTGTGTGTGGARRLFIQTETTPNENSLKFKPGRPVTGNGGVVEFLSAAEAQRGSDLADDLFRITGVRGVMFGTDFITVTKAEGVSWTHLRPSLFAAIMDHLGAERPLLKDTKAVPAPAAAPAEDEDETVQMIREILDTRVRPTVQEDGGDVQFVGFRDGVVELQLRGACRSCSSSAATLKHGIEGMLMHYIPEVRGVVQAEEPAERDAAASPNKAPVKETANSEKLY